MGNDGNRDEIEFRTSTFTGPDGGNRVEVAFVDNGTAIMVRDSKDRSGPVLRFTPSEWDAFVKGVHAGEFG